MDAPIIAKLTIKSPGKKEQVVNLRDGQSLKLGRDLSNDISLDDTGVSRMHATISASSTGVVVKDLGSTNGTFVNGTRLSSMKDLSSKDIIDLGSTKISVHIQPADQLSSRAQGTTVSRAMTAQLKPVAVSVLVTSVRDYKNISETLPTNDVVDMLLVWTKRTSTIIQGMSGKVDKIVGSSLVATWVGSDQRELAKQATKAALDIRKATQQLSDNVSAWKHGITTPWKASVVVNSGTGLKGAMGASGQPGQQSGAFTFLGDPTNIAFNLEEFFPTLQTDLIISDSTAALVAGVVAVKTLGKVKLRDRDEEVEIYTAAS